MRERPDDRFFEVLGLYLEGWRDHEPRWVMERRYAVAMMAYDAMPLWYRLVWRVRLFRWFLPVKLRVFAHRWRHLDHNA